MNAETYSRDRTSVSAARLWFGVIAAAVAWVFQGLLGVVISSLAATRAPAVRVVLAVITVVLLALAIAGGIVSWQNWRRLSGQRTLAAAEGRSRVEFLALSGIFISAVFVAGIVWAAIPLLMVEAGVRAR